MNGTASGVSSRPDSDKLLEVLLAERQHHFDHPAQVTKESFVTFAAALVAFLGSALTLKLALGGLALFTLIVGLVPLLGGFALLVFGLAEHQDYHAWRRLWIEGLIQLLLEEGRDGDRFLKAWNAGPTPPRDDPDQYRDSDRALGFDRVLLAEPDLRTRPHHHDTKILLGLLICFCGPALWLLANSIA